MNEEWQREYEEIKKPYKNGNGHDAAEWKLPPWEHPLETDFPELDLSDPTPAMARAWAIPGWLPMLETIGFGGPAGEGKTLLAHMLGTAVPLRRNWLGLPTEQMKSALVLFEDRKNDVLLRQADINRYYGCRNEDLAGRLLILPRRDNEYNYLAIFDRDGELHLTQFFHQLLAKLKVFGARLVVLDGRGDVFWGNQNDERHARVFVRKVSDRIARELGGCVVLLYHPSRSGRVDGTGESGSVQWDAAFRARLLLWAAEEEDDPDLRRLVRKKSNFSGKNEEILIRWDKGVFRREEEIFAEKPAYEHAARASAVERVWHHQFAALTKLHRPLSPHETARNYAPKLIHREHLLSGDGVKCGVKDLHSIMNTLISRGFYRVEEYGRPSEGRVRIVRVENEQGS